jgi:predicted amidohydrolase YtcJ
MKCLTSVVRYACLLAVFALGSMAAQAQTADLILHNGKILTVDKNFSTAEAVAVSGNKIAAVGSDADVMKLKGSNTQVIDLKGKTVVPGLIDSHRHMYSAAEQTYGGLLTAQDPSLRRRLEGRDEQGRRAEHREGTDVEVSVQARRMDLLRERTAVPGQRSGDCGASQDSL